jgi:choline dehydrogenase-like flavoprotein
MVQVQRSAPIYDVVVIGSGAGGGTVVHTLTKLGVKVLLLVGLRSAEPGQGF